nr:putative receptor-like protein kinase At3g47110 [Malus domestica]
MVPSSIYNISSIEIFSVVSNQLHGELPPNLGTMLPNLVQFYCGANKFEGNIPISLSNASRLQVLELPQNDLSGTVPGESLGSLQSLVLLNIADNQLGNRKVGSIANFSTQLNYLTLGENFIHGNLPNGIGNLINLTTLELGNNYLGGSVPHEIGKLEKLEKLYLDSNIFSGSIPSSLGNMTSLLNLYMGGNSLDDCASLECLYLQGNKFQGTIPQSLKDLKALEKLDVSSNNLYGQIPEFIGKFGVLKYLNLSYNDFEGELPKEGIFTNVNGVSILGNHKLCGGIPQLYLPPCPPKKHHSSRGLHSPKVVIPIACVLGIIIALKVVIPIACVLGIIIALSCFFGACSKLKKSRDRLATSRSYKDWKLGVSYSQLVESTNGFSVDNLIGLGSFGSVYKGVIPSDGTTVVVKVLNLQQQRASKSFIDEWKALRTIRHRSLLKIITACSSIDNQGKDFKSLVFELMANGSLDSMLYPRYEEKSPSKRMSFMQRLNIVIDVASALDYLHHHCEMTIIHCDLKPSNVLLDEDMVAHVGDFGLASQLHTTYCMYVLAKYGTGGQVSILGDVYSYGILLLEMFTRKKPTDDMFKGGLSIYQFVAMALPDHVMDVVDHSIILDLEKNGDVNNDIVRERTPSRRNNDADRTLLLCNVTKGADTDGRGCQKNERNQSLNFND